MKDAKIIELYRIESNPILVPKFQNTVEIFKYTPPPGPVLITDSEGSNIGSVKFEKETVRAYKFNNGKYESWIAVEEKLEEFIYSKYKGELDGLIGELHHSQTKNKLLGYELQGQYDKVKQLSKELETSNEWRNRSLLYRIFYSLFKN